MQHEGINTAYTDSSSATQHISVTRVQDAAHDARTLSEDFGEVRETSSVIASVL